MLTGDETTNSIYEIENIYSQQAEQINELNYKQTNNIIHSRMGALTKSSCTLILRGLDNHIFANNLILIDSRLPEILAAMLCGYYSGHATTVQDLAAKVCANNPNNYDCTNQHRFYEYKIKRLLCETALGMRPKEVWHGNYDATGGYLVVKEDGEIVCYHLYNRNQFENYLFLNTKFETPSSSRHQFGSIFEENKKFFLKLNLQIRFI